MAEGLRPLEFSVLRALMPNPLQQQCSQAGWGGQVTWAEVVYFWFIYLCILLYFS
ncbi:hypothetical protein BHE74_00013337 [Ensete ventricosum]|uniref:Uncharacterized protein n=1 Tax=Ensete ventricosum TaxID=4639 RepID=A0A426XAV4_ENSVE|nr:hypothetical protein B296_00045449 [Ensete ventricosum]RWW78444.1 hypothetical protein BHE74_00013337 [Ensete ventricosum]RZR72712.1 hypothetical protein BHM03_00016063 [Ensete ventricosum]